ncbi:aldehyde dehydrogenase family protein [Solwaraspora sp. WMMD792]|uniref:aldehyde dehydrogenase family protein n=1 Tax=Solwaraspora sp. WMMD792 TaxID=3016099 RepID=UPI0024173C23|nr:aldehyde dehydrogenase family protein [Solwaraspora sp. WMMD792]MDG4769758.1 aldehyde dehydrogenase family protein [Solwaraspora sp. WMMD792]
MTGMTGADAGVVTVNPATGEELDRYPYTRPEDIDRVLDTAAGSPWGRSSVERRCAAIHRLGDILAHRRESLAALVTLETGKPIRQARAEIDKCVGACRFYADQLPEMLRPETFDIDGDTAVVRVAPIGVVLSILPWNYPWWQVIRAMLPAIGAGDTVVLKHAESVTGSAMAVAQVFQDAFGAGVLQTVVVDPATASELIADRRIAAVTFTGSDRVGALVAARAGAAIKKCVLELGGSDPFIVLADADIPAAAAAAVESRFLNNGQSCIAAKRILVHRDVYDEFVAALVPQVMRLVVGDPADERTDVGPLARNDLRDLLREQRGRALAAGGRILAEVAAPETAAGAWFSPSVIEVDSDSVLLSEETFGPLGALTAGADDDELVACANSSRYGLSSSVWSADDDHAGAVSARIQAGAVFVNTISATHPRLPTGGVKASGYGRELGRWGVHELANVQALRIRTGGGTR